MKATIKNTLEFALDTIGTNVFKLDDTVIGGSDTAFIPEDGEDPTGEQFTILDSEKKVFELDTANTFNKDILSLISTPIVDVTGIIISAYTVEEGKKANPIRFRVNLKLTTMGAAVDMGSLSNLSLLNFFPSKIEQLFVDTVVVPTGMVANLVVVVFSKKKLA